MARRKRSSYPGLTVDGPVEAVEEDFAKGLSHWLQAGPWQVGVANRPIAHGEGAQIFKALLSLTGPLGTLLSPLIPDDAASPEDMAAALAPLSLLADVLAVLDTRRVEVPHEEVLLAIFGDDLTADEADELLLTVARSTERLQRLAEETRREPLYVSLLLVYLDDAVVRRHLTALGTTRIAEGVLRLETYFISLPAASVEAPWLAQQEAPPTIEPAALGVVLDFMKHYRRERRIAEKRLKARAGEPGAA